ncbi:hypothetical protein DPMN_031931 [Dreissena polymorpha]|uniref:Uncharacterized protein n=1 Tax=Dreissena polymorpha TaxID=45954 RepID=A0A9D4M1X8_DREPO|nr:hypothetical protein DPMN_031931 [Dreissena polymorpha]
MRSFRYGAHMRRDRGLHPGRLSEKRLYQPLRLADSLVVHVTRTCGIRPRIRVTVLHIPGFANPRTNSVELSRDREKTDTLITTFQGA